MSQIDEKQIPEEEAKQGRTGGRVLMVLVAALVLAAVAWAIAELYGEAIDEDAEQTTSVLLPDAPVSTQRPAAYPVQGRGTSTLSAFG